jgi:AAA domain
MKPREGESAEDFMRRAGGSTERYAPGSKGNGANTNKPRFVTYSLSELRRKEIVPLRSVVPLYIYEGLTIFAGRPKIGKSWFVLMLALAVARKKEALGQFIENGGDVLYGAFEDGERRMKDRVAKILGPANDIWPANFHVIHQLAPLDAGGLEDLENWLTEHPRARMIVLDVFGRIRGQRAAKEDPYQHDTRVAGSLQALATRYGIAIILVHHVRKGDADDILDTISGTTGLAGAADTPMILSRTKDGKTRLYLRGRDAEEQDKEVDFDPETGIWTVVGDYYADDEQGRMLAGLRRNILDILTGSPRPLTATDIAERIPGAKKATIGRTMRRMAQDRQISPEPGGKYGAYVAGQGQRQ